MARQDLLDQGCSRSRHPEDQDRRLAIRPRSRMLSEEVWCEACNQPADADGKLRSIEKDAATRHPVTFVKLANGFLVIRQIIERLTEREMQIDPILVGQS